MKIKVLTLAGETKRQAKIASQLHALAVDFEFFHGVDGKLGHHWLFERYNEPKRLWIKGEPLLPGQLGCFASHFLLWQDCIAAQESFLVLEDDALIDTEAMAAFIRNISLLEPEFQCIRLFRNTTKHNKAISAGKLGSVSICKYLRGPMGTVAYYLTPAAAEKFVRGAEEWVIPVDMYMDQFWKNGVECYGIVPGVVFHDYSFESMIGYIPKHTKPKRSVSKKFRRELYALLQNLKRTIWNARYRLRNRAQ